MTSPGTLATAATLGAVGAVAGGTVSVGMLVLPAWFVFAAAGYLGGTAICAIHNYSWAIAVDRFLKPASVDKFQLKLDIDTVIMSSANMHSTSASKLQRYLDFSVLDRSGMA